MDLQKQSVRFIIIHDLVDPDDPQGRTYKQVNAAKSHAIPIGALVEDTDTGVRLFVVEQTRDCNMEPLYSLSPYHPNEEDDFTIHYKRIHGYGEDHLKVIAEVADKLFDQLSPGLAALYNADSTVRAELDYYLEGKCTYTQALHAIACKQTAMLISIKMDLAQLAALYKVAAQESVKLAQETLDKSPGSVV